MSKILLDDPAHAGGSDQVGIGASPNDGTGDQLRVAFSKMKQWATDLNSMMTELYNSRQFSSSVSAALGASQDNYNPAGYSPGVTNRLILTPFSGGSTINGLLASPDGWTIFVYNPSTTDSITFAHDAGTSLAANQFSCPGAVAAILGPLTGTYISYLVNQWVPG